MNQPPPAAKQPGLAGTTPEQRVAIWLDLVDACEQMVLAGLRLKIGPDGDLKAAYRKWNQRMNAERANKWDRPVSGRTGGI